MRIFPLCVLGDRENVVPRRECSAKTSSSNRGMGRRSHVRPRRPKCSGAQERGPPPIRPTLQGARSERRASGSPRPPERRANVARADLERRPNGARATPERHTSGARAACERRMSGRSAELGRNGDKSGTVEGMRAAGRVNLAPELGQPLTESPEPMGSRAGGAPCDRRNQWHRRTMGAAQLSPSNRIAAAH